MSSTTTRAMTPLAEAATVRQPRYLRGPAMPTVGAEPERGPAATGDEKWFVVSADGRWAYDRVEATTTPWEVTYLPTGQVVTFTNLDACRRWTAADGGRHALANLRAGALLVVTRSGAAGTTMIFAAGTPESVREADRAAEVVAAAERCALARRCLAVLDGLLVADEPDTRCTGDCGGYLTSAVAGVRAAWVHADACRECIGEPPARRRQCRNLHRHVPCGDPDPVLCDHSPCSTATLAVLPVQCERGYDACCGCCG